MSQFLRNSASAVNEEDSWLSVSDLMAGLMVIFLFIAIIYIRPVLKTQEEIERITTAWTDIREEIYQALKSEFEIDLRVWEAELKKETLTIKFAAPDILFRQNETALTNRFRRILDSFFPRYLSVLKRFEQDLAEIRIEGHTSSEWTVDSSESDAYFKNMELSQGRTRSVLEYSMIETGEFSKYAWAQKLVTANGLSSSQPILLPNGLEDSDNSRRVEFRIRTSADQKIQEIIENLE